VFAALPRLLERVAPLAGSGSITGIYTVLVEGDDLADPVADSARSLLDGHIVLSRELASRGHFPAIDVLASTSRVARQVTPRDVQQLAARARDLMAARREAEELRSLGAYVAGVSPRLDRALDVGVRLDGWARQGTDEVSDHDQACAMLGAVLGPEAP
jgi:flagellar biosynthesis/type III secretory pathway ATPase